MVLEAFWRFDEGVAADGLASRRLGCRPGILVLQVFPNFCHSERGNP